MEFGLEILNDSGVTLIDASYRNYVTRQSGSGTTYFVDYPNSSYDSNKFPIQFVGSPWPQVPLLMARPAVLGDLMCIKTTYESGLSSLSGTGASVTIYGADVVFYADSTTNTGEVELLGKSFSYRALLPEEAAVDEQWGMRVFDANGVRLFDSAGKQLIVDGVGSMSYTTTGGSTPSTAGVQSLPPLSVINVPQPPQGAQRFVSLHMCRPCFNSVTTYSTAFMVATVNSETQVTFGIKKYGTGELKARGGQTFNMLCLTGYLQ